MWRGGGAELAEADHLTRQVNPQDRRAAAHRLTAHDRPAAPQDEYAVGQCALAHHRLARGQLALFLLHLCEEFGFPAGQVDIARQTGDEVALIRHATSLQTRQRPTYIRYVVEANGPHRRGFRSRMSQDMPDRRTCIRNGGTGIGKRNRTGTSRDCAMTECRAVGRSTRSAASPRAGRAAPANGKRQR